MRTPQLGPCPSHSQRNWAVLTRLRCEQTIVAQPRVTPAGGVPRRGSQVQKKKKKKTLKLPRYILIYINLSNYTSGPKHWYSLLLFQVGNCLEVGHLKGISTAIHRPELALIALTSAYSAYSADSAAARYSDPHISDRQHIPLSALSALSALNNIYPVNARHRYQLIGFLHTRSEAEVCKNYIIHNEA